MKRFFSLLALVAALAAPGAALPSPSAITSLAPTKPCSAGYVHAALSWGHKCLRVGQYCKRSGDREYHQYGFHCHGERLRR